MEQERGIMKPGGELTNYQLTWDNSVDVARRLKEIGYNRVTVRWVYDTGEIGRVVEILEPLNQERRTRLLDYITIAAGLRPAELTV